MAGAAREAHRLRRGAWVEKQQLVGVALVVEREQAQTAAVEVFPGERKEVGGAAGDQRQPRQVAAVGVLA
jgi:hypothetical protein